jgi:hypothetical protein
VNEREREVIVQADKKTSLITLLNKANEIQSHCEDYQLDNVSLRNAVFDSNGCKLHYLPTGFKEGESRTKFFTPWSLRQMCSKIGVSSDYIDKCIDSGRLELAEDNVNSWLDDFGKNLLIREYKDNIRGVVSDQFSMFDTPEIIQVLGNCTPNDYKVSGYYLTPERFHARIIQKNPFEVAGRPIYAGFQTDSSDVGRSTLIVQFFIHEQICTNGAVITRDGGILYRQIHKGVKPNEFYHDLVASMNTLPILVANAEELIKVASKDTRSYQVAGFDEEELREFAEKVKFRTKLSDEAMGKVIELMTHKYDQSRWGLVSSITEVAQEFTLEKRLELERSAGDMLVA